MGTRCPLFWATSARHLGCRCPSLGLPMPTTWSLRDHLTGTDRPFNGQLSICSCLDFHHLSLLVRNLPHFNDTSIEFMILRWYIFVNILKSVIFVKTYISVLYIDFTHEKWDFETFFEKKNFLRADNPQVWWPSSDEPHQLFSSPSWFWLRLRLQFKNPGDENVGVIWGYIIYIYL